ncbi:CoA transferase [Pseudomonas guariconensis]|uniref:CaiB/BaiF CoA transferase family protein n=1 Tax=Pseudomonas TaxID=286 RepID=UPI0020978B43|nr:MULTISPECIES: CoA transferase [Pseudomonas]MCO7640595.1 CoA transferase [Pseudomonas sp. S 311-6]MCO7516324.1 CoA transferase [Pseudomonas putida]MCO7566080.1 CoA transferase [Pseudomonas mosselii]MCO7606332.1 CoA transferase [Pseudomonas guariconensis]MCO7617247.1 CoA transferase [Pseudomonas guariconensis]
MSTLPLEGIRVVELSHMVMGPACGMVLADLGAEVIKVEPLKGDGTRHLPGAGAGFFRIFNRNKKSVAVDLGTTAGREAILALVDSADVFIENFKPGRMAGFGLDYDTLHARNPALIYVSHKGFLKGPYEHRLALDEVVQMMGGLAYMTGPAGQPLRAGSSVNDIMGGMFGAIGVLAALHERNRTGRGKAIQSGLFENCVLLCAQHMQQYVVTGQAPAPMPSRISAWSIYDVFRFAGDEQMFVAATGDRQWAALCRVLGQEALLDDPSLATNTARVAQRPRLLAHLAEIFATLDAQALAVQLERNGIPFAAIRKPEELFNDPHLQASGGLATLQLDDGSHTEVPLLPLSFDGRRFGPRLVLARVGEHTVEVMRGLGYDHTRIEGLQAAGIFSAANEPDAV